ncbi:phosphotransferase family protein [Streptomyces fractus]|uniref:phosphotransferase family protein n=1 Tax=Streptomyces fractus TaxID=641806 RepID=UPI003CEAF442
MRPLKHGYTNRTVADGTVVEKAYEGPDAAQRLRRERTLLPHLQGQLPVPPVLGATATTLTLGFLPGAPGQDLLNAGHPAEVLSSCGTLLRRIHELTPPAPALGTRAPHDVLVHGDFGPNNLLLDPDTFDVTAVVDWEFAHFGPPVEDLAWCEWIVRTHHPAHRDALTHFFRSYGADPPPWPTRRTAMLTRCEQLRHFCERWEADGAGARLWRERAAVTAGWEE